MAEANAKNRSEMNRFSISYFPLAFLKCLPLALGLSVAIAGCDGSGPGSSGGSDPDWTGNREAVDAKPNDIEYPPEGGRVLFSFTTDSITRYSKFQDPDCDSLSIGIDNIDGDIVTATGDGPDPDTLKLRLETSSGMLTITPVEPAEGPGLTGSLTEIAAEPIGSDPASALNCSTASSNAQ
jgi:hypothetical protein